MTKDDTDDLTPAYELDEKAEVAARGADTEKPGDEWRKVFIAGPTYEPKGFDHDPNKAATREFAIQAGLHPTGDVRKVSEKAHADGVSTVLTYGVKVAVAHRIEDETQLPEVIDHETGDVDKAANAKKA